MQFGYNRGLPEGTRAAFGARLIWPNDLVPNRISVVGERADKDELLEYLTEHAPQPVDFDLGDLRSTEDREVCVFDDGHAVIKVNPQASAGYLYVVGYLRHHVPEGVEV